MLLLIIRLCVVHSKGPEIARLVLNICPATGEAPAGLDLLLLRSRPDKVRHPNAASGPIARLSPVGHRSHTISRLKSLIQRVIDRQMQIPVLYSKIHRATVTDAQLHYEGSLTLDSHLMRLAGLTEFQQIQVYNIANGNRFETYLIEGEAHSGIVQVNGAAAHLAQTGNLIIIAAYAQMTQEEARQWQPTAIFVDKQNRPTNEKPALMPV